MKTPTDSLIIDDHLFVLSNIQVSVFKLDPVLDTFKLKLQIKIPSECLYSQSLIFKPDVNINKLYIEARKLKSKGSVYVKDIMNIIMYTLDVDSIISKDVDVINNGIKFVKLSDYLTTDLSIKRKYIDLNLQSCQYFSNTSLILLLTKYAK
jgi:hypothetical protein